jgi:hypothetical protein
MIHGASLSTRVLQGMGLVAFVMLARIILYRGAGLPLGELAVAFVLASISGGVGGVVYYFTDGLRAAGGLAKTFANVISILAYCIVAFAALILVFGWG